MNTVPFPNQAEIEAQAAAWIAVIDRGLTDAEQVEFETWLNASPVQAEVLLKCASMWDLLEVLSPIAKLMPMDAERTIAHISESNISDNGVGQNKNPFKTPTSQKAESKWYRHMAVAASLILTLGVSSYVGLPLNSQQAEPRPELAHNNQPQAKGIVIYKTAVGEISKASLPDGSELQLNTNTELHVRFDDYQRAIELIHGEAFFEVAKDPSKPFVVMVGRDSVTAVGTAFSVDASLQGSTEVLVTEGKVRVKNERNEQPVYLESGQKALVQDDDYQVSHNNDLDSQLAWRDQELVFQGESLDKVIQEINRYTPLTLKLMDPDIASIPVGGFFKTGDLNQLLQIFEYNLGVSYTQIGDEILLTKSVR